jgi:hypothetical protein
LEKNEPAGAHCVVAVQFVVLRSIYPRPVNHDKKEEGITDVLSVGTRRDMTGYLPDARYVNKIIEQLKPADLALVWSVLKSPGRPPPSLFVHSAS